MKRMRKEGRRGSVEHRGSSRIALWSSRSGQLLIATTIAPTTAIRTHNNSLSPHRFIRVRICGLPAMSDAYIGEQSTCL